MLAGVDRLHALRKVNADGGGERDQIDRGIGQQLLIAGVEMRHIEFLRHILRTARNGIHHGGGPDKIALILLAGVLTHGLDTGRAGADNADAKCFLFHVSCSSSH